mmetsp:Transcript_99811/g.291234  ORF Transcript_99811/g.291234 Transcript_99811/m.291234 type:complete len:147 (-) Transcript_99811:110-550(-)
MLVVIEPWFSLVWRCQSLLLAVKGGQTWESLGSCEEQCRAMQIAAAMGGSIGSELLCAIGQLEGQSEVQHSSRIAPVSVGGPPLWESTFGLKSGVPGNRGTLNILEGIDGVGSLTLDFDFVAGQTGRALSVVCPNCPSGQVGAEAM